ncbi:hypothetical protein HanXRQr2_Chr03g0102231 [Helianthus annuus]|uniref:Transposase (putative) gypsy type domain-containing protein n=1 Tax=Helianthus annuus TaxID=4232 RepID=A0A9K3NV69_HELAN|nr:hypothetical protein HanXRQr2_Chr03g0102231 [Helianthus annuus]
MGARKDQSTSFSCLTQEEVEAFCLKWGIDPRFNPEALGLDKSIDQCPKGSIALFCKHFEYSNLRYPLSIFVLNVMEYYRVSFGQLHPKGLARVLHFEVLCRAVRYDPPLLSFRRFSVDVCLISSMVTTLGSWKDRFFWFSESIVPFKMIWRHLDAVLNELEPSEDELDSWFLKSIRTCPSRLRPFPEPLLVLMGISTLWDKLDRDPVLMRDGQVMSTLDFLKSDDTSDVVFADAASAEGEDAVDTEVLDGGKKCELPLVAGKDAKAAGKKVGGSKPSTKAIESSSNVDPGDIYVPDWKVTVSETFKSPTVCEDVLNHFAPPTVQASLSSMVMMK